MCWIYFVAGLIIGFGLGYFIANQKIKAIKLRFEHEKLQLTHQYTLEKTEKEKGQGILNERLRTFDEENNKLNNRLQIETQKRELAEKQQVALQSDFRNLQEKLETQKKEVESLQEKFKTEFENVANKILKQNTKEFNESSCKNLNDLLLPLKEKIYKFEKKVEDTYQKGLRDQTDLKVELKKLHDLNVKLGEEAGNLTRALKSDTKKQGNWGEVVLERILERSGLIKNEEYFLQYTVKDDDNKMLRPDVLIKLPEGKHLIIDSKVSLTAYEIYVNTADDTLREKALKQHLLSIRNHIKELKDKSYDNLKGLNTPDFVLMFMPIEPAFALAVQSDAELFNDAWEQRIVIVSPTTLLATLRTVASIWQHERQNRNALEIAKQGGKLYDKFEGFLNDLEKVGINLDKARESFEEARKKLTTGRGNLIGQIEKLKELGAKANKQIDSKYLEE